MDNKIDISHEETPEEKEADAGKTLLLITASCSSCVRAKKFFTDNNIPFVEENFYSQPITEKHFKDILSLTENGVYDIISQRSKFLSTNKINIDELKVSELISLIQEQPSIVKRPIILQYDRSGLPKRLMIGYNRQDIKVFCRPIKDIEVHLSDLPSDDCTDGHHTHELYGDPVEHTINIDPIEPSEPTPSSKLHKTKKI